MNSERDKPDYRISVDNAALLLVDHQSGLFQLVRDKSPVDFYNHLLALVDTARLFKVPTVLTTSYEEGPNGPILPEVRERLPKSTPLIRRPGEINAWDNPQFVKAVEKTGRKQLIVAGIVTEVCVAQVAISAARAGYQVYVATDASGTLRQEWHESALARMGLMGVQLVNWFVVASELMRDWRHGAEGLTQLMADHLPTYRSLIASHDARP